MPPFVSGGCTATEVIFGRREVREAGGGRWEQTRRQKRGNSSCDKRAPAIFSTVLYSLHCTVQYSAAQPLPRKEWFGVARVWESTVSFKALRAGARAGLWNALCPMLGKM
jgi:hypothetical protein